MPESLAQFKEKLLGDEAAAAAVLAFEGDLPYMARVSDFTEPQIKAGHLREADEKAERENRAAFRESIKAAIATAEQQEGGEGS